MLQALTLFCFVAVAAGLDNGIQTPVNMLKDVIFWLPYASLIWLYSTHMRSDLCQGSDARLPWATTRGMTSGNHAPLPCRARPRDWLCSCNNINAVNIKAVADAMVANGLFDLGYHYLVCQPTCAVWSRVCCRCFRYPNVAALLTQCRISTTAGPRGATARRTC